MDRDTDQTVKSNVAKFDEDIHAQGSYVYTADKLSSRLANAAISRAIVRNYDWRGKRILDVGCGDGSYSLELAKLGVEEVLGIDPAEAAIEVASAKAHRLKLADVVRFQTGNIYALGNLLEPGRFDCIVLRGVLHHLPDAARAIRSLSKFEGSLLVLEPNGNNPVLKLIERFSKYHVEHEERSFAPAVIKAWLAGCGFKIETTEFINLVPFFCPDPVARALRVVEPIIEGLPVLRDVACGQVIVVASK